MTFLKEETFRFFWNSIFRDIESECFYFLLKNLIYNVVLISGVKVKDSVMHRHIHSFQIFFPV